jgi:hypothetical protein
MTELSAPTPVELATELASRLRDGVSGHSLRGCEAILGLSLTRAKSASDETADLAVAADTLIREAARRVDDGDAYGPASALLGLAPGSRDSLLKDRRRVAAELLHISTETLRKEREDRIVAAVADELHAADSAYRLRHRHRSEAERSPEQTRLGVDWLEQHRSYRRIWTPISGMCNDIAVLREYLAAGSPDQLAIADRLVNISWHWARFELAVLRFVDDQGGLWLLADVETEIAVADAVYKLELSVPLGETDNSWLRTVLADTPHGELDGFGDLLIEAGERRRELMSLWVDWAGCSTTNGSCDCQLHAWIEAADTFIRLIDSDWYRVADWYRA